MGSGGSPLQIRQGLVERTCLLSAQTRGTHPQPRVDDALKGGYTCWSGVSLCNPCQPEATSDSLKQVCYEVLVSV